MPDLHLAQVNVARLRAPLDDPQLADFVANLAPVNALADDAPGFVWRLASDGGDATDVEAFRFDVDDSPGVIVNLSVWQDVRALAAFVFSGRHVEVLRRRREWFTPMRDAFAACWWVPAGHVPDVAEAEDRVLHLREHGPTAHAFTLQRAFAPDGTPTSAVRAARP